MDSNLNMLDESKLGNPTVECRKKLGRPQPLLKFCEPPVRKVKEVCMAVDTIPPCDIIPFDDPKPLLGPVTLLNYSSNIPINEKAALVHKALRRRRGKISRVTLQDPASREDEICEETDAHLWDVSDLGLTEPETRKVHPVILRTKKTLSELGRDTMIGSKFRKMLSESLQDWRLAKEVYGALSTVRALKDIYQKHPVMGEGVPSRAVIHRNFINAILGDEALQKTASRSFECRMLVKSFEEDFTMAGKLAKCTEIINILDEADKSDVLKQKIHEINKKVRHELKKKVKESPMSPWVDLPHWFALLSYVKNRNPPRHIQPFLLIDWSMENKTSSMYKFHQEYKRNVDRQMIHDFVTETALLVTVDESEDVNETMKEATFHCDVNSTIEILDDAIAHREDILDEIEGMKAYLKKIEDINFDGLDFGILYEKPPIPKRLWSFENVFSNTLHPMNACELLDEIIRPKILPTPSSSETDIQTTQAKSEVSRPKFVLTEQQTEKSQLLSQFARLSVDRIKPVKVKSSKTLVEVKEESDQLTSSMSEENSSDTRSLRGPSRIRFALKEVTAAQASRGNSLDLPKASRLQSHSKTIPPETTGLPVPESKHSSLEMKYPTSAKTI